MPVTAHVEHPSPRELRTRRQIIRFLRCERGSVQFEMQCNPRFDYGSIIPHTSMVSEYIGLAHGGRDAISIFSTLPMRIAEDGFLAEGTLYEGGQLAVSVTYEDDIISRLEALDEAELLARLDETVRYLAGVGRQMHLQGRVQRRRRPIGAHPEGADIRTVRRDHRRAYHLPPRGVWRRTQLGLSLYLDP